MPLLTTNVICKFDYGDKVSFYTTNEVKEFFDTNTKIKSELPIIGHYNLEHFFVHKKPDNHLMYVPEESYQIILNFTYDNYMLYSVLE